MIQEMASLSIERALMDGIKEMVFIVRVDDNGLFYEFINQAALNNTDLDQNSVGKTFFETQASELATMIHSQYMKVLESGSPVVYEDSYKDPKGKQRYSKTCLTPMFNSLDKCTHVVSIVQDVTGEVEAKQKSMEFLKSLEESRAYYHSLFEQNADAVLTIDLDGQIKGANPVGLKLSQLSKEELYRKRILDFVAPEDQQIALTNFQKAKQGEYINFRINIRQKENKQLNVLGKFIPIKIREITTGFYVILKDTRELDHMVELYIESEKNFRIIAENAHDIIILINRQNEYLFVSPSLEDVYGFSSEDYRLKEPFYNVHPEDEHTFCENLNNSIKNKEISKMRIRLKHKDEYWIWSELHGTPVFDDQNVYSHMVIIVRDVSLQKGYETQLEYLAFHDTLTSLPNRRFFQKSLEQALNDYQVKGSNFAVLLLDIDKFKSINDQWGHETGDAVICEFGERLKTQIRSTDLAARLGGDEFVVLLTGINHEEFALRIIDNIRKAMVRTWRFEDVTFTVSTSIGMTMPDENSTTSSILKEADKAMYEEKEFKRGNVDDGRFSG